MFSLLKNSSSHQFTISSLLQIKIEMIRSLSPAKVFASLLYRRGYGVASRGGVWVTNPEESGSRIQDPGVKAEDKDAANMEEKSGILSAWTPDPVTGFYKPCNSLDETNPAELRDMVFNQHRVKKPQD